MDPSTATATLNTLMSSSSSSSLTPFDKKVYTLLLQIPPGTFTTYGILSSILQSSPRAVGNSCRRNPFAPTVPCHRVVATGGALGGFKGEHLRKTRATTKSIRSKGKTAEEEDDKKMTRLFQSRSAGIVQSRCDAMAAAKKALLTIGEKRGLLRKEGVRFDLKGDKVLGTPFMGFAR